MLYETIEAKKKMNSRMVLSSTATVREIDVDVSEVRFDTSARIVGRMNVSWRSR